jgi:hypothetical protein
MTEKPNDGGPAFPQTDTTNRNDQHIYRGLSMRDYYAGHALAGIIASVGRGDLNLIASAAYEFADAMLAKRDRL